MISNIIVKKFLTHKTGNIIQAYPRRGSNLHTSFPTDSKEQLLRELSLIQKWEKDQKDLWFWEKLGRLPFVLLDRITPKAVQDFLGKVLDELGGFIQTGGKYLISEKVIINDLEKHAGLPSGGLTLDQVASLPLGTMNKAAEKLKESRSEWAMIQGATTGIGGIFTLAIDIPALLGLSLKVLQEMALVYGYNPLEKRERIFIVKCLQFASADYVGKQAVISYLTRFQEGEIQRESISELQGWREVVATYGENFGWKKLFQMVPVIGIIFGAFLNRSTVEDVAEAGMMLYRKRRILEKLESLNAERHPNR
ncbi:EcsC family protein [Thermoactinomyces sp. CICC 10521]|nr:EcsC family protein [Thermoactinomyces sp. CICC 10521]